MSGDINDFANDLAYAISHLDEETKKLRMDILAKLNERVVDNTPVAKKNGGTLREGWDMNINYSSEGSVLYNDTEYAPPVEYGHRTRLQPGNSGKAFVEGKYMLRDAINDTKGDIDKEMDDFIKRLLRIND